jgi:hypothetical protein
MTEEFEHIEKKRQLLIDYINEPALVSKQKEWVSLTDDEIYKIAFALEGEHWRKIADTIEAKLKEKNT